MSSLAATRPARARLGRWPYDDRVAHLVLLDHHMVPTTTDIAEWVTEAGATGATVVRTGALFPDSTAPFLESGFQVADTLTLLDRTLLDRTLLDRTVLDRTPPDHTPVSRSTGSGAIPQAAGAIRLRRLRPSMLHEAADIDRRSFSAPWANDASALADIMNATPYHRSRSVHLDGRMVAFSISGRADGSGYIQRLAVDPSARRRRFAKLLLDDALGWMQRRNVSQVMVNTATDNRPALALYESIGFERQPGALLILERVLR